MKKIDSGILKRLRIAKGWSQEQLAEKTKVGDLPKIDKQTISRLERGDRERTRGRTIDQLAQALRVEPAVLTGEAPLPELEDASEPTPKSQLNVRVSRAARNALTLVADRYCVQPSQIVELAPFLFCWAAEASLRHRSNVVTELEQRLADVRTDLQHEICGGFPLPDDGLLENVIAGEQGSIEHLDIFGTYVHEDPDFYSDVFARDPFSAFLSNLTTDFSDVAKFDDWSFDGSPSYCVCSDEAAKLVGGDRDLAALFLDGSVLLSEMPKEFRDGPRLLPEGGETKTRNIKKERAEWVRAKAEEYINEQENLKATESVKEQENSIGMATLLPLDKEAST